MKRILPLLLAVWLLGMNAAAVVTAPEDAFDLSGDSAVLLEPETGTILYEKDAHTHRSPASVTKVMTLLLIAEAVDSGALKMEDSVTASAQAASMGGSQIWLEEGESMTVDEMIKCIAVASANDCAVAMAEKLAGSEGAFAK
ncbi:MAG: D-alanyl-D-alanine carboxypeptidase, partial [Pyramidobacter sp.]|nr:D-alanyl-D-alanine carboxypeptidase [Pyramidobacter sp.]